MTPASRRATLAVANETIARQASDLLAEILDADDHAIAAFESADGRWDVTVHFNDGADEDAIRDVIRRVIADEAAPIAFDTVAPADWVKASLEGLVPVPAGRFVVHGQHDRARIAPNRIGIEIEAALAFGTGHHGTTRGCLLLLDHLLRSKDPRRILDLGTGTGVLAIGAAKATRRTVLASDIDRTSVGVAQDNARLNGVGNLVHAVCATGFAAPEMRQSAPFDLILANILANPLRQLSTPMAAHLAPEGAVILSGLLNHQASAVIAAYRSRGLLIRKRLSLDGWSSLLMQRA